MFGGAERRFGVRAVAAAFQCCLFDRLEVGHQWSGVFGGNQPRAGAAAGHEHGSADPEQGGHQQTDATAERGGWAPTARGSAGAARLVVGPARVGRAAHRH